MQDIAWSHERYLIYRTGNGGHRSNLWMIAFSSSPIIFKCTGTGTNVYSVILLQPIDFLPMNAHISCLSHEFDNDFWIFLVICLQFYRIPHSCWVIRLPNEIYTLTRPFSQLDGCFHRVHIWKTLQHLDSSVSTHSEHPLTNIIIM